jgi:hypothetical protein
MMTLSVASRFTIYAQRTILTIDCHSRMTYTTHVFRPSRNKSLELASNDHSNSRGVAMRGIAPERGAINSFIEVSY